MENSNGEIGEIKDEKAALKGNDKGLRVEDVFKQLGGFSYYQIFATIAIISLEIPAAMITLSPVLTGTSQVNFYCESEDGTKNISMEEICGGICNGTIKSDEPHVSIVQEWGLYCDRAYITETLTSIQMLGAMLGPVTTAHVADQYGRKPAYYIVCLLMVGSGIASALSNSIYTFGAARFVAGFAAGGCLVAHMNYLMEYLTPSWRVICGCINFWPLGEILLGLFGWLFPSWRILTGITSTIPPFLLLFTFPFLHESPRWLLCKKRTKEATKVLNSIARWNRKPEPEPGVIEKIQFSISAEEEEEKRGEKGNRFIAFIKNRVLVGHILVFSLVWFTMALTYMGISFNMKNMSGNRFLNVALMGVFDFPAEWSGIFFSNKFGRKVTFISTLAVASVMVAVVAVIQLTADVSQVASLGAVILTLCLLARFLNESSWCVMGDGVCWCV